MRLRSRYDYEGTGGPRSGRIWNLDVDLERRDVVTLVDLYPNLGGLDGDVPADDRQDLFPKNSNQAGLPEEPPFVY